jgi:hypothetical protein
MYLQWPSIILLSCRITNATELLLPVAALVTGNLIARQEYTCPAGDAYTWCPGREGCCLENEPCYTSAGRVHCIMLRRTRRLQQLTGNKRLLAQFKIDQKNLRLQLS